VDPYTPFPPLDNSILKFTIFTIILIFEKSGLISSPLLVSATGANRDADVGFQHRTRKSTMRWKTPKAPIVRCEMTNEKTTFVFWGEFNLATTLSQNPGLISIPGPSQTLIMGT
jgi:hypothetical protein